MRRCPKCGSPDVRRSVRRRMLDFVLARIGLAPYRCRNCRTRFFRQTSQARAGARAAEQRREEARLAPGVVM